MARIRQIKPQFFVDEDIGSLSMPARLMFIGLWTLADREGRIEDKPGTIKVQTLPFDAVDANQVLDEIATKGLIHRYTAGGRRYLSIRAFVKHQRPHPQEPRSTFPPPPPGEIAKEHGENISSHGGSIRDRVGNTFPPPPLEPERSPQTGEIAKEHGENISSHGGSIRDRVGNGGSDPGSGELEMGDETPVANHGETLTSTASVEPSRRPPATSMELLRLFDVLWVKRWNMPFRRSQWVQKDADALMRGADPREFEPAIVAYLACDDRKFVDARHTFALFEKNFDRFRGPPPKDNGPHYHRLKPLPEVDENGHRRGDPNARKWAIEQLAKQGAEAAGKGPGP